MADVIPIFMPGALKPAIKFREQQGQLKRMRKPPRRAPSRRPEASYLRMLLALLARQRALIVSKVLPRLEEIVASTPFEIRAPDRFDAAEVIEEVMTGYKIAFAAEAPLDTIATQAGSAAAAQNATEQKRIVQTVLGIRPELNEPWLADVMAQFTRTNAQLVGKVTEDFSDRLERRIGDRVREGFRAEQIAKEVERDFVRTQGVEATVAKKRAKLIARDQIASLQGDITRVRQQSLGVQRYIWRTAQDERVRDSHRDREGEVFVWGEPIQPQLAEKGLEIDTVDGPPGKPINCRCYAEPVISDLVEGAPDI